MTSTAHNDLQLAADELHAVAQNALGQSYAEDFAALEQTINRFDAYLRELHQESCRNSVKKALNSLDAGAPLTPDDLHALRELVVGDANAYLKAENNLDDWLAELTRLVDVILEQSAGDGSDGHVALRGATRDAARLIPTVRAYFEDRHRLELFDKALAQLDDSNRRLLAQIVREKLSSRTR